MLQRLRGGLNLQAFDENRPITSKQMPGLFADLEPSPGESSGEEESAYKQLNLDVEHDKVEKCKPLKFWDQQVKVVPPAQPKTGQHLASVSTQEPLSLRESVAEDLEIMV
jgi:hypothetical protein